MLRTVEQFWNEGILTRDADTDAMLKMVAAAHTMCVDEVSKRMKIDASPILYTYAIDITTGACCLLNSRQHHRCRHHGVISKMRQEREVTTVIKTSVDAFLSGPGMLSCAVFMRPSPDVVLRLYRKKYVDMLVQRHSWSLSRVPRTLHTAVKKIPILATQMATANVHDYNMDVDCISVYNFIYCKRTCASCGVTGNKLQKCGKCLSMWYCSKECQRLDWHARHKDLCNANMPIRWVEDMVMLEEFLSL